MILRYLHYFLPRSYCAMRGTYVRNLHYLSVAVWKAFYGLKPVMHEYNIYFYQNRFRVDKRHRLRNTELKENNVQLFVWWKKKNFFISTPKLLTAHVNALAQYRKSLYMYTLNKYHKFTHIYIYQYTTKFLNYDGGNMLENASGSSIAQRLHWT